MLSVVMPIYISSEHLKQLTLETIYSLDGQYDELIIVDDASPMPTSFVKEFATTFIQHKHNKRFTTSINDGIRLARYEYILCINNDLRIESGVLQTMCREGTVTFPKFVKKQTPIWDGAFFIMPQGYTHDEVFTTYFSDVDLFWRMKQDGIKWTVDKDVLVFHHENQSHRDIRDTHFELDRQKFKNKWGFDALENKEIYP